MLKKAWLPEHAAGQQKRKRIARFFAWLQTTAGLRKTRHQGYRKLDWDFTFAAAAYTLTESPASLSSHTQENHRAENSFGARD